MFVRSLKIAGAVIALAATTAAAQKVVSTKMGGGGSPHETVEWTVQGAKITHQLRPAVPEGAQGSSDVAPAGKIWRTGADEATTLTTDKALMFGSLMIPAGTYTLYTVPGPTSWKLVVSKQTGQWGTEYQRGQGSRPRRPQGRDAAEAGRPVDHRHRRSQRQPDAQHRLGHHAAPRRRSWCTDCL